MSKINSIRRKLRKSGQINIAETVVSVTIMLVLAVSVAQLGSKVALNQNSNTTDIVKKKAQDALDLGVSLGYIRELAYASTNDLTKNQTTINTENAMQTLISENLPLSAQYSLFQHSVNNPADPYNNRTILGIKPIPSGNLNIFSVSVFVSGFFNSTTIITTNYVVTLIVAYEGS